jgi:uncharacterized protein YukE
LLSLAALALAGPVATSRPAVSGTLQQGRKLTANPGSWSGHGTISYRYQWYRCNAVGARCTSIHGATLGTYVQVRADVGRSLAVTVSATDQTGTAVAYSALAGVVAKAAAPIVAEGQPPLAGDALVGQTLIVGTPRWTATAGSARYAWLRCNANGRLCIPIGGATASTYAVASADAGHVLIATVTVSRQTVLSAASGVVRATPGPVALAGPSVSGTLQAGKQLTGTAGVWSGNGGISYAYQWYRCDANGAHCNAITGATRNTYRQVAADAAQTLALTVRATDTTGTTAAYSSLAGLVAPATAAFATKAQPSLAGTPAQEQALAVTGGAYTVKPASFTYAWLRCNANGRACTQIPGATSDTYTVTADDAGHVLVAAVTAAAADTRQVVLTTAAAVAS